MSLPEGKLYPSDAKEADITIYGNWISQPSRAVLWTLLIFKVPFRMVTVAVNKGVHRSKEFRSINPYAQIPVLVDTSVKNDKGEPLTLFESGAILTYLADKYKRHDWFPPASDVVRRAKANEYLHLHHSTTRNLTRDIMRMVFFGKLMGKTEEQIEQAKAKGWKSAQKWLQILDKRLESNQFILGDKPTLCDIHAYCELGQFEPAPFGFDGPESFKQYKNIQRWMQEVRKLPAYNEAHAPLQKLTSSKL